MYHLNEPFEDAQPLEGYDGCLLQDFENKAEAADKAL